MSDVPAQDPVDTGTPADPGPTTAPEVPAATEQPGVDYSQRYDELRAEFNRHNNLVQRAQQGDPDALSELGFELYQEEQQQEEWVDPTDALQARLDALEAQLTQSQTQAQQEQIELASAGALHDIDGFSDLPAEAQDWIWGRAKLLEPLHTGQYDVESAYTQFQALNNSLQQSWASSKQGAPRPAGSGPAATNVPPNEDATPAELAQWAKERWLDQQRA